MGQGAAFSGPRLAFGPGHRPPPLGGRRRPLRLGRRRRGRYPRRPPPRRRLPLRRGQQRWGCWARGGMAAAAAAAAPCGSASASCSTEGPPRGRRQRWPGPSPTCTFRGRAGPSPPASRAGSPKLWGRSWTGSPSSLPRATEGGGCSPPLTPSRRTFCTGPMRRFPSFWGGRWR